MNYTEFSSKIKSKYPQYVDMDDKDLAQRMVKKFPQYSDVTFDQGTNWKGIVGNALKNSVKKPLSFAKDIGTNPETMANVMPGLLGTAGGLSPIPGGATMGTGIGQGMRDLSLKALKKPIPSGLQHAGELGLSAIGDIAAIPSLKAKIFGNQIGEAERAAGVITRAPTKAVTPGSVGETLNNLEAQLDSGTINTPQAARDAKAVVNQIYKNPRIYEQTGDISVQSARVSKKVQNLLNKMVPARQVPAQALGKAMTIPNTIKRGWQSLPWPFKRVAQAAPAIIGIEEIMRLLK